VQQQHQGCPSSGPSAIASKSPAAVGYAQDTRDHRPTLDRGPRTPWFTVAPTSVAQGATPVAEWCPRSATVPSAKAVAIPDNVHCRARGVEGEPAPGHQQRVDSGARAEASVPSGGEHQPVATIGRRRQPPDAPQTDHGSSGPGCCTGDRSLSRIATAYRGQMVVLTPPKTLVNPFAVPGVDRDQHDPNAILLPPCRVEFEAQSRLDSEPRRQPGVQSVSIYRAS